MWLRRRPSDLMGSIRSTGHCAQSDGGMAKVYGQECKRGSVLPSSQNADRWDTVFYTKYSNLYHLPSSRRKVNSGISLESPSSLRSAGRIKSPLSFRILVCLLAILQCVPVTSAVRCYCTDDHCIPAYGVCEGTVCLVGIRRPDQSVIRTCGDEPLGCQKGAGNWADVCACDRPFCNTFSYLRESIQNEIEVPPPEPKSAESEKTDALTQHAGSMTRGDRHDFGEDSAEDEDRVLFNRFDLPPGEYIDEDGHHHKSAISTRTSLLTMLLVIVPLSVGAATVMVVSFNYYCHLC
ncbi:unnamed protein product [Bursaphelenchus xylophilus]|uniref:(pine wood nematode) hypothetical protein n=1 Tax=Bursaphelenchus xylophilus TaxID=6326 RepID=A0A811LAL7_BURXY|nr:unnamed protein product [Bursaphelenchus xylophilus]CAG9113079.1 unnamed protein product [Bursaphelenchus xylophilus]